MRKNIIAQVKPALAALAAAVVSALPVAAGESGVHWHSSVEEGVAAAKARNRPIVMVFPEGHPGAYQWFETPKVINKEGKKAWPARDPLRAADAVLVKVVPPKQVKLPVGVSREMAQNIFRTHAKLQARHQALMHKYAVTRLPSVRFLSPDGETMLVGFTRRPETEVLHALRHMPHYLHHYRQAQAILRGEDHTKIPATASMGWGKSRLSWHASIEQGLAEARRRNRPAMLIFVESRPWGYDWFGPKLKKDFSYNWWPTDNFKTSEAVLIRVAPPTRMALTATASEADAKKLDAAVGKLIDEYVKLKTRYDVTRIPSFHFLSPDGKMVLHRMTRMHYTLVHNALRHLPHYFYHYRQAMAIMNGRDHKTVPSRVSDGPPANRFEWYTSLDGATPAAYGGNRPIALIFVETNTYGYDWLGPKPGKEGALNWANAQVAKRSGAVIVKLARPTRLGVPGGADEEYVKKLAKALEQLDKEYETLTEKYRVRRAPSIHLLSPDAQTVFHHFTRIPETLLHRALGHLPHHMYHYRVFKALLAGQGTDQIPTRVKDGPAKNPFYWYMKLEPAVAEAKRRNRPILLVFTQTGAPSYDWFGPGRDKSNALEWSAADELRKADMVLVKIAPTTNMTPTTEPSKEEEKRRVKTLAKMGEEYVKVSNRYKVSRIPAIYFLTPDGRTVLKGFTRVPATIIIEALKDVPALFKEYGEMQKLLKDAGG